MLLVSTAGLLQPAYAQQGLWNDAGGSSIYLNATGGTGQLVDFSVPGDGNSPQKAYFGSAGVRVLTARVDTVNDPDNELGNVVDPVAIVGDSCIRVVSDTSADSYNNGLLSLNVVAQDKSVRSGGISSLRTLVSIQGSAPVGDGTCETNDPPVATSFTTSNVDQGSPTGITVTLGSRISDPNGDALQMTFAGIYDAGGNPASVGTITSQTPTGFTFVPNPAYTGTAIVQYQISDGFYGVSSQVPGPIDTYWMQARVSIPVVAVPHAPVATDDTIATDFEAAVTVDVLDNDEDQDGDTLTITAVTTPDFGQAAIVNNEILYTPPAGYSGPAVFDYTVSDGVLTDTGRVEVTIRSANSTNQPPTVRIDTPSQNTLTFPDTDGAAGESVSITAVGNDPEGAALTFRWIVDNGAPQTTQTPTLQIPNLADGSHSVSVSVSDGIESSPTVGVTVVVTPAAGNALPTVTLATVSGNSTVVDSDGEAGESVAIRATATDSNGTIDATSYRWAVNGTAIAALNGQATVTVALPDGDSTVGVTVADNQGATSTATITVTVSAPTPLLEDVAANPVQAAVGRSVDTLCPMLNANAEELTGDAPDLLGQCSRIIGNSDNPDQQRQALQALSGEELQAAQTASINFGKVQASNVAARLQALRNGARGVSLSGLNLMFNGDPVPLQLIGQAAKSLGGGASSDEPESLTNQRLGVFLNGKVGFGEKDTTENETGYDYDSIGATLGLDYRFTDSFVAGLALGYSESEAEFVDNQGNLKSDGLSGTLFSSLYGKRAYLDLLVGFGQVNYDSLRHITYEIESDVIDRTATGDTDGTMTTAGLSFGYDVGRGGWTITPNASITYMKVEVDGFTETGSQGLDLEYGDQSADSMQYQAGLQLGYRFSREWGVITPQVYGSYVVDKQDLDDMYLRFANDPFSGSPTQPGSGTVFFVSGDDPDEEYLRWGVTLSAVFANLVSAFVNYESYADLDTIKYSEVTVGIRMQTSF